MTEQNYLKTFHFLSTKKLVKPIILLLKLTTLSVYIIYPAVLVYLLIYKPERLAVTVLAPFISFVLVTIYRNLKNAKRPYEAYGFKPLYPKNSLGKSFPSRHTFSVFVIATAILPVNLLLGITLLLFGLIIAFSRVVLGIHFIKDVVCGAVIGILCGVVCFIF